jgi:uncharacterized membrane protein YeaQ/YmgE (transglycosylase-associated protein family)
MNPFVWAALGAVLGWFATLSVADKGFASKVETIGAGIFGASIGGGFQVTLIVGAVAAGFQPVTLVGALVGAVAMLMLLGAFRKAVGPLKTGKKKSPTR